MRARITYTPVWLAALVPLLILVGSGVGDIIPAGARLRGIRRRAQGCGTVWHGLRVAEPVRLG